MRKHTMSKLISYMLVVFILLTAALCAQLFMGNNNTPEASPTGQEEIRAISQETKVRKEIYYSRCHHLVSEIITGDTEFAGKSFEEIENEGWSVFWADDGKVVVFRELEELCPDDAVKRHLGVYEGYVAIYAGPSDCDGELIEALNIKVESLYPQWQEMLISGGIDFTSEEELFVALESLDEF